MGQMKFMFPNAAGHLPPRHARQGIADRGVAAVQRRLRAARGRAAARRSGCSASRSNPEGASARADGPLPKPVPVYITYLTAVPSGSSIAYFDDIYGRDAARLAETSGPAAVASRLSNSGASSACRSCPARLARPSGSRAGLNRRYRVAASQTTESTEGSPLDRTIRQPDIRPSG